MAHVHIIAQNPRAGCCCCCCCMPSNTLPMVGDAPQLLTIFISLRSPPVTFCCPARFGPQRMPALMALQDAGRTRLRKKIVLLGGRKLLARRMGLQYRPG